MSANAASKINYSDFCQDCVSISEGMLFRFIHSPRIHGYFSSEPNFLVKITALACTNRNNYQTYNVLPH